MEECIKEPRECHKKPEKNNEKPIENNEKPMEENNDNSPEENNDNSPEIDNDNSVEKYKKNPLKKLFKHYKGQPIEILTSDGVRYCGLVLSLYDDSVEIIDKCSRVILIPFAHIDAIIEPKMKITTFCGEKDCTCHKEDCCEHKDCKDCNE